MTSPGCQRWMEDPAANRAHLDECAACRAAERELEELDATVRAANAEPAGSIATLISDRLPVAPWEGAGHRPWALVAIAFVAVAFLAAAGFALIGLSPLEGFRETARGMIRAREVLFAVSTSMGSFVRSAPLGFHLAIGIGFVVVNAVLIAMLRRGPRGYDVRSR